MTLKVFDLQCDNNHIFEGWFSSNSDYEKQILNKMIECPICSSPKINKRLSAPYIGKTNSNNSSVANEQSIHVSEDKVKKLLENYSKAIKYLRQIIETAEDVGENFAKEARLIKSGESEKKSIKGTVSSEEKKVLEEEGIEIMQIPDYLDDKLIH